jgi:hypothetical protein
MPIKPGPFAAGGKQRRSEAILQNLEAYLSDGIHRDREDIAAIERVLIETGETILQNFNDKTNDWPYEILRHPSNEARGFSQSTTAMMIHAIDLLREAVPGGPREPYPFKLGDLSEKLVEQREAAFKALVAQITPPEKHGSESAAPFPSTWSSTYGTNDPLTLSFLAEILPASDSGIDDQARPYAKDRQSAFLTVILKRASASSSISRGRGPKERRH